MPLDVLGGSLAFDAVIKDTQFEATIRRIEGQLQGLTQTATKEAAAIDNLIRKTTTAIAGYASFSAGSNFISDIVKVRGEFQQLEIAFTTMLGSKQRADKLLQEVTQFAATTPFELTEVAKATKQLLAFGIAADDIQGTLRALGDVSAGIGAPLGDIAYLFGTIKTQGVALTQDVRQFAQRGIPIYEELAKILKVNTDQVDEFITAGKIGFPEIQQVFQNLTAEGSKFGGLMEAQSKSLTGQISNLRDAWAQMLNTIGKGGEGIFSDIIQGATFVVKNFDDVIDILKVLVIVYGSYKAAIIATIAVQAIATTMTKGYTIAETLRYQAMLLSERAAKLLNATMLRNPFVAVATGLAALVATLVIFTKRTTEAQRQQKVFNDIQTETNKAVINETNALNALLKVARDETLSKQQRETAIRRINAISPEYLNNLTLENLKTAEGKRLIDAYISSLRKKAEAHAIDAKLSKLAEERIDLQDQADRTKGRKKGGLFTVIDDRLVNDAANAKLQENLRLTEELESRQKLALEEEIKGEDKKQGVKIRSLSVIEDEIKSTQELQKANAANAGQYSEYQKKINALEAEKKRITGASKSEIKAVQVEENKALAMLEKRKDLLQQIEDQKRNSDQSGLTEEVKKLDQINERYDGVLLSITEYNKKVEEFNKKNPKNKVQQVGLEAIKQLNDARAKELNNQTLKEDADKFKDSLDKKMQLVEQFEQSKKEVGLAKSRELYGEQAQDTAEFLKDLQQLQLALAPKISLGIANVGEVQKFKNVSDLIKQINEARQQAEINSEKEKFTELLTVTATFNQQKTAINKKYDALEATLKKNSTVAEFEERKKILDQGRQQELTDLDNQIAKQSALYKKLNQDILLFSRERLQQEIKLLQAKLKADTKLTPQQKADIKNTINQYKGLLNETNATAEKYSKISNALSAVSGNFSTLADAVGELDAGLGQTLQSMSDIASIGADAAGAIASFATGDILGGINSAVSAISKIIKGFAEAKQSRIKAQQDIRDFQEQILAGEIEYNELIRDRQREEVKTHKLKMQGLKDEKKLLEEQKKTVLDTYNEILAKLQKESFTSGKTAKTKNGSFLGGVLGFLSGTRTTAVDQLQSLAGKTFEEMEKLFLSGQLNDNAKKLFEQLQSIKQEGVDIDRLLAENAQAMREALTGTTAESLTDVIASGFADGKKDIADFAGTFEDAMRNALIQSLKFKYLEGPLKDFFEEFAAATESDGQLTSGEINELRNMFNTIIGNADSQFQQLQQIAGINLNGSGSSGNNSLTGAIRGITEQTAELIAGQFGGLRLTAIEQLNIARQGLNALNNIQTNTASTVARMVALLGKYDSYETGQKKLHVTF